MKHKFRLTQLLKYRGSIEDQRRIALSIVEEKRYIEQEKLFQLQEAQRLSQKQLGMIKDETSLYLSCLEALAHKSFSQKRKVQEIQKEVIKAREVLLEASKERKKVEKLRDRELERHRQFLAKQERKYLDEVAARRYTRYTRMNSPNQ